MWRESRKEKVLGLQIQKLSKRISELLVKEAEGIYVCITVVFLTFKAEDLLPFTFFFFFFFFLYLFFFKFFKF